MTTERPAPRLYVILALEAPCAVVFRRGPSDVWSLFLWHTDTGELEPGAATKGQLKPRRCDLSPDGRYLVYYMQDYRSPKPGTTHESGIADVPWPAVFSAISRPPWLYALAMYYDGCSWGEGMRFEFHTNRQELCVALRTADSLEPEPPNMPYSALRRTNAHQSVELDRGWRLADSPVFLDRTAIGPAHSKSKGVYKKSCGSSVLWQYEDYDSHAEGAVELSRMHFILEREDGTLDRLGDPYWADWNHDGNLLIATNDARLLIRDPDGTIAHEAAVPEPNPFREAPDWAQSWTQTR